MNQTEVIQLLTIISGYDPRMYAEGDAARVRVKAWSIGLADIDASEAAAFVTRYYKNAENRYPIQIGDIATGCKPNPRWEDRTEHQQLAGRAVPMPDDVKRLLNLDTPDHRARKVSCSWCKAGPGQNCTAEGKPLSGGRVHPSRLDAAA